MPKKMVQVEVSAVTFDVAESLELFLLEAYKAAVDGFQPGQDIPAVLQAAMVHMVPHMKSVPMVAEEFAADPVASVYAVLVASKTVVEKLVK